MQLLTTPLVRINWFRWSCLERGGGDVCSPFGGQKQRGQTSNTVFAVKEKEGSPERADLLNQWQAADADVNLTGDAVVFGVHGQHDLLGGFVKNLAQNPRALNIDGRTHVRSRCI